MRQTWCARRLAHFPIRTRGLLQQKPHDYYWPYGGRGRTWPGRSLYNVVKPDTTSSTMRNATALAAALAAESALRSAPQSREDVKKECSTGYSSTRGLPLGTQPWSFELACAIAIVQSACAECVLKQCGCCCGPTSTTDMLLTLQQA